MLIWSRQLLTGQRKPVCLLPDQIYIGEEMAIGNKIYVAGGWNNGSLDVVEVYNVSKNKCPQ